MVFIPLPDSEIRKAQLLTNALLKGGAVGLLDNGRPSPRPDGAVGGQVVGVGCKLFTAYLVAAFEEADQPFHFNIAYRAYGVHHGEGFAVSQLDEHFVLGSVFSKVDKECYKPGNDQPRHNHGAGDDRELFFPLLPANTVVQHTEGCPEQDHQQQPRKQRANDGKKERGAPGRGVERDAQHRELTAVNRVQKRVIYGARLMAQRV